MGYNTIVKYKCKYKLLNLFDISWGLVNVHVDVIIYKIVAASILNAEFHFLMFFLPVFSQFCFVPVYIHSTKVETLSILL